MLKRRTCPIREMQQCTRSQQNARVPPSPAVEPLAPATTTANGHHHVGGNGAGSVRMPKVEILRNAIEYIAYLEDMLRTRSTPASSFGIIGRHGGAMVVGSGAAGRRFDRSSNLVEGSRNESWSIGTSGDERLRHRFGVSW